MAAQKKTINVNEFYSNTLQDYVANLQKVKPEAGKPLIVKANTTEESALNAVEKIIKGNDKDKKFNRQLLKMAAKKGITPTVKKVYQNVLVTFFKTNTVEYDYRYSYNGNIINISPKKIAINEGHAEFSSATQCYVGEVNEVYPFSYPWEKVTDDMLTDEIQSGYVIANVNAKDYEKDSKESMRQYNEKLNKWVNEFEQERLGAGRSMYDVTIYDKDYDYNELVLLVPFILVSYDLGNSIVTFPVCAITGNVETPLLNNPAARFEYDESALPPSFSIVLCLVASVCMIVLGGVLYTLFFISRKISAKSKSLNGYTIDELKKLL
ncbi:MAG: hypothetical protein K2I23_01795 [Clostridia bacterium]|nr:hypothetical protein [Clostridia bacterium]